MQSQLPSSNLTPRPGGYLGIAIARFDAKEALDAFLASDGLVPLDAPAWWMRELYSCPRTSAEPSQDACGYRLSVARREEGEGGVFFDVYRRSDSLHTCSIAGRAHIPLYPDNYSTPKSNGGGRKEP